MGQTVPLLCSTVCRRRHGDSQHPAGTGNKGCNIDYAGSTPAGENRCLVVKAIKRHLSRVSQRRKTWSLPACFDFRKEHGILRPPRKQNDCSISGQKKSVQQGACLYCLRRQNKPYPMVRSRELHTAPALCRALAQENQGEKIP